MRSLLRKTLLACGVLLAPACNDSTGPDNFEALVGTWVLISIDGDPLPVVVDQDGEDTAEITAGVVELDDSRLFSDDTSVRFTIGGVVTTEVQAGTGTWGLDNDGNTVIFDPTDGSAEYIMEWDGGITLTQNFDGFILVYQKANASLRTSRL